MKIKFLVLALLIFGLSSCAYRTCPTYAKQDAQQQEAPVLVKERV